MSPVSNDKDYLDARERALVLLSRREHSEYELTRKLLSKGVSTQLVDRLLEELKLKDYLSDQRFCECFVRDRIQRGYGPVKIRYDLHARGISEPMIEMVVDSGSETWESLLKKVWIKKYRGYSPANYNEWAKQARFLQSRGFTSEQIRKVIAPYD